jgi:hypothetical protein
VRKSKPSVARQVSVIGRRTVVRTLDDGIMTIPIPPEDREHAHEDMHEYIRRQEEKSQYNQ